ncbi:MAG: sugar ABC transporter permease [Clostridiales bacterium]|nr:MAG: sugar ABC transporter permease [Clostridiales bacterium]
MSIIFVFPIIWVVLSCFSASGSIYSFNGFFPSEYSLDSFKALFADTVMYDYPKWFANTLLVATISSLLGTVLVILTAYVISSFQFKGRKSLMKGALILGMFPSFMGMVAVYLLMTQFNFINSHIGLLLYMQAVLRWAIWCKKAFSTLFRIRFTKRQESTEQAMRGYFNVTLPLSKPILVYTLLTQFAWPWSDFILPKLLLKDKNMWTAAVGLMSLPETEFARFSAGAVFIAVRL